MLIALTVQECCSSFQESIETGLARSGFQGPVDKALVREIAERLAFEWIKLVESSSIGQADDRETTDRDSARALPRIDWVDVHDEAEAGVFPFGEGFGKFKKAAKGLPAEYLGYRQVRVQDYILNMGLDMVNVLFSNPGSIVYCLALGLPVASAAVNPAVSAISAIVPVAIGVMKTNYGCPKLDPFERCVYVKMWDHDLADCYALSSMATWFGATCDIPKRRYWKCGFRVGGGDCRFDAGRLESIAESLCEKGFFRSVIRVTRQGAKAERLYGLRISESLAVSHGRPSRKPSRKLARGSESKGGLHVR